MNYLKQSVGVLCLLVSGQSYADQVFLREGDRSNLGACGGTASFVQKRGQYVLSLDGVERCSNLDLGAQVGREVYTTYKVPVISGTDENGARAGSYTLPAAIVVDDARNTVHLRLRSNKAAKLFEESRAGTWDDITLEFGADRRNELTLGDEVKLPRCGGTVQISKSSKGDRGGDQLNIVLRNVQNCSDFIWEDLVNYATGDKVDKSYSLQRNRQGDWGGSFTLSWDFIRNGKNRMSFYVTSNSGKTLDRYRLTFWAIR